MPKGARKFEFSFEGSHLTHFGGMWLIQRFCNKLRLRRLLQQHVRIHHRTSAYHPSELILALLYAIIMGLRRINKTEILQYNGAFLEMLGLERFPDQSTLRRFLRRLTPDDIRRLVRLHDSLRAQIFQVPHQRTTLVFNVDSVVLVLYGRQEGAAVGYNPKKPGRRSYHPIFCFESHFQEFWHGSLRGGKAGASSGAVGFIRRCLAKAPSTIARSRIRFRMDAGFYGQRIVRLLDGEGCGYVIVVKEYPSIRNRLGGVKFTKMRNGWEVGEFREKVSRESKTFHRFIVVRRPIPEDPVEARQLTLFKIQKYAYHVFVTNLKTSPWRVYLFYNGRATVEKNNREFLYDYPLGKIPTDNWLANVAFFHLMLFAANIVHWFKRICLPREYHTATVDTIRTDFLVLPSQLVRRGSRKVLLLPHDHHYQREFLAADEKIRKLRLREKFRFCKLAARAVPMKTAQK